jgi:hypothetical protein
VATLLHKEETPENVVTLDGRGILWLKKTQEIKKRGKISIRVQGRKRN